MFNKLSNLKKNSSLNWRIMYPNSVHKQIIYLPNLNDEATFFYY